MNNTADPVDYITRNMSGQKFKAYDTRYVCRICGGKGKFTTADHAQILAESHLSKHGIHN